MAANSSIQNLYVDIQGSMEGVKPGGDPIDRVITIRNQGNRLAEVEVWIEPLDLRAAPLRQWSTFDKSENDLKLSPQESIDVILSFLVPLYAEQGFYSYDVRVRSPQYQGEEIRRAQQLHVLVSEQDALRTEPKITIAPATDSNNPYLLQSGAEVVLTISVENPSLRTDRFFLTCPDLPPDWFTVTYPEKQGDGAILLEQTDGLQLNPKEVGQVQLQIHPPSHAPAGDYFPTIRLTSVNRSDLVILEIVYLTIPIDDRLVVELTPSSRKIPAEEAFFEVSLVNPGNISRNVTLAAADSERVFNYPVEPNRFLLLAGESAAAVMQPRPRHWWRQLWRLREQTIEFRLEIQNVVAESWRDRLEPPVENAPEVAAELLPALPSAIPNGNIIWKARRRWLFFLLLWLLGLGLLTTTALLLWYFLVWRPSFRPLITDFSTLRENYREGDTNTITFNWQVTNPERIGQLHLLHNQQNQAETEAAETPQEIADQENNTATYYFNQVSGQVPIPPGLADFCTVEEVPEPNSIVNTILRWNRRLLNHPENTEALTCVNVPLKNFNVQEGTYTFQLQVFRMQEGGLSDKQKIEKFAIAPPPPPEIRSLTAAATAYSVVMPEAPSTAEENAGTGATVSAPRDKSTLTSERPLAPIRLNWEISNYEDIQSLSLVSLAPDGSENVPAETFDFENGIPGLLQPFCRVTDNTLTCNQVLTSAANVGEYVFYLTVTPKRDQGQGEIVKTTATIPIKPPLPEIVSFALNGEDGQQYPKRVFVVNPARGFLDVVITWQVRNATQVELLPAPGTIEGSSLTYTISAAPGSEIITLRAINELEEEVTQSIVIEKVGFDPTQPISPAAANAEAGGILPPPLTIIPVPTVPIPSTIPRLPPAQEPPRAN